MRNETIVVSITREAKSSDLGKTFTWLGAKDEIKEVTILKSGDKYVTQHEGTKKVYEDTDFAEDFTLPDGLSMDEMLDCLNYGLDLRERARVQRLHSDKGTGKKAKLAWVDDKIRAAVLGSDFDLAKKLAGLDEAGRLGYFDAQNI